MVKFLLPASLRNQLYSRACRKYSSDLVMVTGCQRSGTTLLMMMLGAHPGVRAYDESETKFEFPSWRLLRENRRAGDRTCIKHPMATPYANWMASEFPRARNLFLLRHPCSVVSSMHTTRIYDGKSWLEAHSRHELSRHATVFPDLEALELDGLSDIEVGAHVWKTKSRVIEAFREQGLWVETLLYEALLSDPEEKMRWLLDRLELPWADEVLQHEKFQNRETFAGGTRGDQPLDPSRMNPDWKLTEAEQKVVLEICATELEKRGFE